MAQDHPSPRSARLAIGRLVIDVAAPEAGWATATGHLTGVTADVGGPADVDYRVTDDGQGRYGLERSRGGLRRNAELEAVTEALEADIAAVVRRRLPDVVLARAGVVRTGDRAVVVVGPPGSGTTSLVSALVAAGGTRYADGLALFSPDGLVGPIAVSDPAGGDHTGTGPLPAPVPVALLVNTTFEAGTDWFPTEITGSRAVLNLLGQVVPGAGATARDLVGHLAGHVVELRGPRPDAVAIAADLLARAEDVELPAHPEAPPVLGADPVPEEALAPTTPRFIRFDDFLDDDAHARLIEFALSDGPGFAASSVTRPDEDDGGTHPELRRSITGFDLDEVWDLFEEPLRRLLPAARRELGIEWFELDRFERQMTAHGDGDHFTVHVDNRSPDSETREITIVYYFNRQRRFSGGELWLFDTVERDGVVEPLDTHTEIVPEDNSLVMFAGDAYHEVRPVHLDSDEFADRRFSIVCWARCVTPVSAIFRGDPDTVTARQHRFVPSLTDGGYTVVPTPDAVHARLSRLLDEGRESAAPEGADDIYLPSGDPRIVRVDAEEGGELLEAMRGLHEEFYGGSLEPSAAYGIRIYGEGQTLRPHCDRVETHVISSVVHIAADVDEPWPLTILDADGRSSDVVLDPGQTLLYESAKLPHARETPLRGRSYASMFLHYRPVDWTRTLAQVCRDVGPDLRVRA